MSNLAVASSTSPTIREQLEKSHAFVDESLAIVSHIHQLPSFPEKGVEKTEGPPTTAVQEIDYNLLNLNAKLGRLAERIDSLGKAL